MFFGLTELSSIPLNFVYLLKRFPELRKAYPTLDLLSKVSFSLSFLVLRVGLSSKISYDLQWDLYTLYASGTGAPNRLHTLEIAKRPRERASSPVSAHVATPSTHSALNTSRRLRLHLQCIRVRPSALLGDAHLSGPAENARTIWRKGQGRLMRSGCHRTQLAAQRSVTQRGACLGACEQQNGGVVRGVWRNRCCVLVCETEMPISPRDE